MPITSKAEPCTEQWKVYDQMVADAPAKPAHIAELDIAKAQLDVDMCYIAAATYTPINEAITTEVIAASVDKDHKKARFAVLFSGTIERPGQPTVELDEYLHSFTVSLSEVEDDDEEIGPDGGGVLPDGERPESGNPAPARPEGAHHERKDWR